MYDVKKSIDVELNVQLVYTALIHEYAYDHVVLARQRH